MRQCILHIGIPKTGSSSIQKTLHMNRDRLVEAGILYQTTLSSEKGTAAHHKLGANVRGTGKQNRLEGINLSEFEKILRTTPADIVLISTESLSHPRLKAEKLQHLAHLITANGFAATAVAYIRPQPPLANSAYTQAVKSFQFEGSFDDFTTKRLGGAGWHMNERLAVWFDQPNVRFIAVPFTPENTGLDIAAKMLKLAGVPSPRVDGLRLEFPGYVNEAPGPLAVAAFRMLARDQQNFRALRKDTRTRRAARMEAKRRGWFRDRFVGLDDRRVARIRTLFEEENERFARRCFARPWHDVFAADYERLWEPNEIELDAIAPDQKAALDDFLVTIAANSSTPDGVEEQGQ